jgi:hypothetical protein
MTKPVLIITHGMGTHTAESFKKDVVDSLNASIALYPSYKSETIEKHCDIVSVEYNDIFDEYRKKLATTGDDLTTVLTSIPGQTGIDTLTENLSKFKNDKLFYTHWLDVILYRFTVLGEVVRIRLGQAIVKEIAARGGANVNILGHSLGTSAIHDTLAKLFNTKYKLGEIDSLSPSISRIKSCHLVANVSRLLESFVNVGNYVVNPGSSGCISYYREYRHKLDPFTLPKAFNPAETPPWVESEYDLVRIKRLTDLNTHSIKSYLMNPKSHRRLFESIYPSFFPSIFDKNQADKSYELTTLKGQYEKFENKLEKIKVSNPSSIQDLIKTAIEFRNFVESIGGNFITGEK